MATRDGRADAPEQPSWEELITAVVSAQAPLDLVAQPVVDLASGDVAGYELLSRFGWPVTVADVTATPPPDRWFAAAAFLGLAADLTVAVLGRAMQTRRSVPGGAFCTVNVGPDVLPDPRVRAALDADLRGVVIELTEHSGAEATAELVEALDDVRSRGALVALDDTGTGYAGLSQLMALRPDIVKLDRHFTQALDRDERRRHVVRSVRDLAGQLGSSLVAEGVETYAECEALVTLGVPLGQGWFLGAPERPWPSAYDDVRQWIRALADRERARGSIGSLVSPLGEATGEGPQVWLVRGPGGAPASVAWRGPDGRLHTAAALTVDHAAPVAEVLRQALARPEPQRWAPPVVVAGVDVLGWVDIGEVVGRLTASVPATPRPPATAPPPEPADGPVTGAQPASATGPGPGSTGQRGPEPQREPAPEPPAPAGPDPLGPDPDGSPSGSAPHEPGRRGPRRQASSRHRSGGPFPPLAIPRQRTT